MRYTNVRKWTGLCLLLVATLDLQAARVDHVKKGSPFAKRVVLHTEPAGDQLVVTLTVPGSHQGYVLHWLGAYDGPKKLAEAKKKQKLKFTISRDRFAKTQVTASYFDPGHKPGETGGSSGYVFQLGDLFAAPGSAKSDPKDLNGKKRIGHPQHQETK